MIMHSAQTISETMNCEFFCKNRMIVTETMALQASHDSFNPSQYHCQLSFGKADVQEEYFYVHDVKRHLISINSHCAATAMYLGCVESDVKHQITTVCLPLSTFEFDCHFSVIAFVFCAGYRARLRECIRTVQQLLPIVTRQMAKLTWNLQLI